MTTLQSPVVTRPPLPPFNRETQQGTKGPPRWKTDGTSSRSGEGGAFGLHSNDSRWRNRRRVRKWKAGDHRVSHASGARELDYRLIKELWAFDGNRIAVRFVYEWRDDSGNWFRSFGNENWEFAQDGLMQRRFCLHQSTCPSKHRIASYHWPLKPARRPSGFERSWSLMRLATIGYAAFSSAPCFWHSPMSLILC